VLRDNFNLHDDSYSIAKNFNNFLTINVKVKKKCSNLPTEFNSNKVYINENNFKNKRPTQNKFKRMLIS
jgi:hypothetical protein